MDLRRDAQGEELTKHPAEDPEDGAQNQPKEVSKEVWPVIHLWRLGHLVCPCGQDQVAQKVDVDLDEEDQATIP